MSDVTTPHPSYEQRRLQWQRIADVLAGVDAIKGERAEHYLPRLPGHRISTIEGRIVDEYRGYLARATPEDARARRALQGMAGMVFRRDVRTQLSSRLAALADNITLRGDSVTALSKAQLREQISYGWGGLLVNWDDGLDRPYVSRYAHDQIVNWRRELIGGRPIPTQVVLREQYRERAQFGSEVGTQYRVVELAEVPGAEVGEDNPLGLGCVHTVWREVEVEGKKEWQPIGEPEIPLRRGVPLGLVPFVPANAMSLEWEPSLPPMLGLVDLILSDYLNSADLENVCHFACAGHILLIAGIPKDSKIRAGGTAAIVSEDPQAKGSWIQASADGAGAISALRDDKKRSMALALARLLLSDERRVAETAEAQRVAFAGDDATLSDIVGATEDCIREALAISAWWMGAHDTIAEARAENVVELNRDFIDADMSAQDLMALGLEVDAGRMAPETRYYLAQRGEMTRPGVTFEEEQAAIREWQASRPAQPLDGDFEV